jgi:hypothetical protein
MLSPLCCSKPGYRLTAYVSFTNMHTSSSAQRTVTKSKRAMTRHASCPSVEPSNVAERRRAIVRWQPGGAVAKRPASCRSYAGLPLHGGASTPFPHPACAAGNLPLPLALSL